MDFIAKQNKPAAATDKPQIRRKRFLFQDLLSGIQGRASEVLGGGLSGLQGRMAGFGGLAGKSGKSSQYTSFEHQCCRLHLQSDCFLNKVRALFKRAFLHHQKRSSLSIITSIRTKIIFRLTSILIFFYLPTGTAHLHRKERTKIGQSLPGGLLVRPSRRGGHSVRSNRNAGSMREIQQ